MVLRIGRKMIIRRAGLPFCFFALIATGCGGGNSGSASPTSPTPTSTAPSTPAPATPTPAPPAPATPAGPVTFKVDGVATNAASATGPFPKAHPSVGAAHTAPGTPQGF